MSDPIIEAAQRASRLWMESDIPMGELAAREMAKPIRELHRPTTLLVHTRTICTHCVNGEWPCATAKLVYSTEELQ